MPPKKSHEICPPKLTKSVPLATNSLMALSGLAVAADHSAADVSVSDYGDAFTHKEDFAVGTSFLDGRGHTGGELHLRQHAELHQGRPPSPGSTRRLYTQSTVYSVSN